MPINRNKHKWRRAFRWICWVIIVQLILINVSAALYAYRLTHFYDDPFLSVQDQKQDIFSKTWRLFTGPKYPKPKIVSLPWFPYSIVIMKTGDGNSIEAWYSETDSLVKGTVILFHGIGGAKDKLLNEATAFRDMGYNVMLVDFRGHGNSSGNITTISIKETEEVKLATEYVKQLGEKKIFLWGGSMGAVAVAKSIGEYHLKVSGIILESPFASIQSHLKAKARIIGFPSQPFAFLTTFWVGVERGFNGFGTQTGKYAEKINCPVLIQWGSKDAYVLKWEINSVFNTIASSDKKLVIYENAFHESLERRDAEKWKKEVEAFLETKF